MNVFQNLVEELKDENLLEQTVIETSSREQSDEEAGAETSPSTIRQNEENSSRTAESTIENPNDAALCVQDYDAAKESSSPNSENQETSNSPTQSEFVETTAVNKLEFYRQRAINEVSGLQMVEHVLSGVERGQMKIVPKQFDDLEVKKVLHRFLQATDDFNSPEHAQLEFQLLQETESWYSALSHRDKHISVAHLRRYCETTRPVLSSQALISMARFYRNSPYSEAVRSKFDLVLTRLFSKETGSEKRELTSSREELIQHLSSLYAEWSSIPLYAANDDDDSEILIMTLKFEDFMAEADGADNFDELIKNDFFNRLRVFKKSTNENFFAPLVTATAIECNVRVGNRYVDLMQQEKEKLSESLIEDKYGFLHDQAISEATCKTLQLIELLNKSKVSKTPAVQEMPEDTKNESVEKREVADPALPDQNKSKKVKNEQRENPFAVNKWLLGATILSILLSIGIYIWANQYETPPPSPDVKTVNLENSFLKDYLKEAKIGSDTFFGIVTPSWDALSLEKKEEVLNKIYSIRNEKGFSKVHLLSSNGTTAGFATEQKVQAY